MQVYNSVMKKFHNYFSKLIEILCELVYNGNMKLTSINYYYFTKTDVNYFCGGGIIISSLTVKDVVIGEGMPKIIVPIVEKSHEDIVKRATEIAGLAIHAVEWRADLFCDIYDVEKTLLTLKSLSEILANKILLFTFRTTNEGGTTPMSQEQYLELNNAVAKSGYADMLDLEVLSLKEKANEYVKHIQELGTYVVGSNHDFDKTPSASEITNALIAIQNSNVDIVKMAVMPKSKQDLLTLMTATYDMYTNHAVKPLVTMSMAPTGALSRLCGEVFGSAMTFGSVANVSAPGQIQIDALAQGLSIIHNSCV